mgnify:CR=1 FL=1
MLLMECIVDANDLCSLAMVDISPLKVLKISSARSESVTKDVDLGVPEAKADLIRRVPSRMHALK